MVWITESGSRSAVRCFRLVITRHPRGALGHIQNYFGQHYFGLCRFEQQPGAPFLARSLREKACPERSRRVGILQIQERRAPRVHGQGDTNARPAKVSRIAIARSATIRVFVTNPEPPASIAAIMDSMSALKKTIGARQPELRRRLATSIPLSPGIEMSSTTTSGIAASRAAMADFPSSAVPTISKSVLSTSVHSARISGMSSTSRTLGDLKKGSWIMKR